MSRIDQALSDLEAARTFTRIPWLCFVLRAINGDKFWRGRTAGRYFQWWRGLEGTNGARRVKEFGTAEDAERACRKAVAAIVRKGYVETERSFVLDAPVNPFSAFGVSVAEAAEGLRRSMEAMTSVSGSWLPHLMLPRETSRNVPVAPEAPLRVEDPPSPVTLSSMWAVSFNGRILTGTEDGVVWQTECSGTNTTRGRMAAQLVRRLIRAGGGREVLLSDQGANLGEVIVSRLPGHATPVDTGRAQISRTSWSVGIGREEPAPARKPHVDPVTGRVAVFALKDIYGANSLGPGRRVIHPRGYRQVLPVALAAEIVTGSTDYGYWHPDDIGPPETPSAAPIVGSKILPVPDPVEKQSLVSLKRFTGLDVDDEEDI